MFGLKRGYIKCPYCANGIISIGKSNNTEVIIDGLNDIRITTTRELDEDGSTSDIIYIPMNFCFKCGRKLIK